MDIISIIITFVIHIPLILGFTFLISGFITSKLSDDEEKLNPLIFIIVFVIVLIALFTYNGNGEPAHMFRP